MALNAHKLKTWPFAGKIAIKERNSENDKTQIHVFHHWTYFGTAENDQELEDISQTPVKLQFDLDTYKLLIKALNGTKTQIIHL